MTTFGRSTKSWSVRSPQLHQKEKKHSENKTKMFIFNFFSNTFLIFNFLRFLPCILLQRLFYYGSEAIEWFILLNYCVNPFDFSLETYLDLVLTQKNRTKLFFIQCTVGGGVKPMSPSVEKCAQSPFINGKAIANAFMNANINQSPKHKWASHEWEKWQDTMIGLRS